jgi:hypothetical protein
MRVALPVARVAVRRVQGGNSPYRHARAPHTAVNIREHWRWSSKSEAAGRQVGWPPRALLANPRASLALSAES